MTKEIQKRPIGRPTKLTPPIVDKLVAAFHNGFNVEEACHYAEINKTSYYTWLENDEIFSTQMDIARQMPLRKAKEVVIGAIQTGDANLAFRYLQARDPEFKPKFEGDLSHGVRETQEKLKEFFDDRNDGATHDVSAEPTAEIAGAGAEEPTPDTPAIS